ncbi:hypothetical protein FACS1894211_08860 [Clostridia bacterium]|nr:hypothetical protein FACS1894211_08860 [Clostridia bacterium]
MHSTVDFSIIVDVCSFEILSQYSIKCLNWHIWCCAMYKYFAFVTNRTTILDIVN